MTAHPLTLLLGMACSGGLPESPGQADTQDSAAPLGAADSSPDPQSSSGLSLRLRPYSDCAESEDALRFETYQGEDWTEQLVLTENSLIPTSPWGLTVADLNQDGWLDVYLPGFGDGELFLNDGAGGLVARPDSLSASSTIALASVAVDLDGDGDLDLVESGLGEVRALLNDGQAQFHEQLSLHAAPGDIMVGPSVADADGDGDLDLYIPRFPIHDGSDSAAFGAGLPDVLLEQLSPGQWEDASSLLSEGNDGYSMAGGHIDLDLDGIPELIACHDHGSQVRPNQVWTRDGEGYLQVGSELNLDHGLDCMGIDPTDLNGDGLPELIMSGWDDLVLAESDGEGGYFESTLSRGLTPADPLSSRVAWGVSWGDMDLDGDEDLFVSYGYWELYGQEMGGPSEINPADQPDALFLQDEEGQFEDRAEELRLGDPGNGRGSVLADINRDGVLDVVQRKIFDQARISLSACLPEANWLSIELEQPGPNTSAIGSRVEVITASSEHTKTLRAGGTSIASGGPLELHFGLGEEELVEEIWITWPDGELTWVRDVPSRHQLTIRRD